MAPRILRWRMPAALTAFVLVGALLAPTARAVIPPDYTAWVDLGIVYTAPSGDAYYPSVIYDPGGFGVTAGPRYKMWYSDGAGSVFVVSATDGASWSAPTPTAGLGGDAHHVQVAYDASAFGVTGGPTYKIWYWDTDAPLYNISAIAYAESSDGVTWTNDQAITQGSPELVTGTWPGWNIGSYGPIDVIYQPAAPNTGTAPWGYSYVMYYDGTDGSSEVTGLAYSADGLTWTAASTSPVLDKGAGNAWDCDDAAYGTVFKDANGYHFWYSGGGGDNGSGGCSAGDPIHEGIGYASSSDGISWTKDAGNPIFHISDGVAYRSERTYTPSVIDDGSGFLKMYYSARGSTGPKQIGLAVLPVAAKQWVTGGGWINSPAGAFMPNAAVVVSPADMNGWAFFEEVPNATGSLVAGPATPPLGEGSARMTLDATGRELLGTVAYAGTRLDQITNLAYSSYRASGDLGNNLAISLQLDVDYNLTDSITGWQGRLVFEPYQTPGVGGTVAEDTWQNWSPLAGRWWASGSPGNGTCPQASPCTWPAVLGAFPDAGLRVGVGVLQFKAGGPWPGFDGNVDDFTIGVNDTSTTYDFEPTDTTGRATFGFVVKYQKNASTPGGNLLFQFQAADLNLKSSSFDWLVVAGPLASFQGTGTVNGVPGYRFKVDAKDGGLAGGQPDHLKIKIWNPSGGLIYRADEDLAGGSITVHAK